MTRSTAREIAIHLAYQLSFTELPVEEFLDQQLSDEILYMADIPQGAAISEAVTIAKKYETPEVAKFINGILGSFARGEVKEKD